MKTLKASLIFASLAVGLPAAYARADQTTNVAFPPATFRDVSYGPDKRNVLDFWRAKSDQPTPLLFYVHGGGWRGGSKAMVPPRVVESMLQHHISVVSINYRYSDIARLPAPVHDAARALQFVRSKAAEWNIDKQRIAAMGASAGACTSLWLAYHDDLADPKSSDPVARESSRLCAAVDVSGQTSIDPEVVVPWVGDKIMDHGMMWRSVGATNRAEAMRRYSEYQALYHEFSPINHVSKGDPPVFMLYAPPTPLPAPNKDIAIHHAMLGQKLKEKADAEGLICELQYADPAEEDNPAVVEFLLKYLTKP